jgi:hypothetical protein
MHSTTLFDRGRDHFFQVPQAAHETSAGSIRLPILYYDTSNVIAFFRAPTEAAAELLQGTGLKPAYNFFGSTIVGLSFYEYRETSVGSYNEVGLAMPVLDTKQRRGPGTLFDICRSVERRKTGFYVVDLPVTTEIANAAGRELWGYPKFVTGIDFLYADKRVAMRVADPGSDADILRLEGRMSPTLPAPPLSLVTYSVLDDRRIRTTVQVRGAVRIGLGGNIRLSLGHSRHPMARHLADLRLDGRKPMLIEGTHRFQSRLNAGRAIPGAPGTASVRSDPSGRSAVEGKQQRRQ